MANPKEVTALSALLGSKLLLQQATLTTAESCTGGSIAASISDISGCSSWFTTGLVTYSEQSKMALLGVKAETLQQFGVVSGQVAKEMASGALQRAAADYAIAVTGYAGPSGGDPLQPVGTVWFGYAQATGELVSCQQHFAGDRQQVRSAAVHFALQNALTLFFKE